MYVSPIFPRHLDFFIYNNPLVLGVDIKMTSLFFSFKEKPSTARNATSMLRFSGDFDTKSVIHKVRAFLAVLGFSLNEKKSEVRLAYQRQSVLGIVVNEKMQVSREYRRNVHQEVYYSRKYGVDSHLIRLKGGEKKQEKEKYLLVLLEK